MSLNSEKLTAFLSGSASVFLLLTLPFSLKVLLTGRPFGSADFWVEAFFLALCGTFSLVAAALSLSGRNRRFLLESLIKLMISVLFFGLFF